MGAKHTQVGPYFKLSFKTKWVQIHQKTTEVWYSNTNEWQLGPNLPNECLNPSVITSPDGKSVIIIGCQENTKGEIFELREDEFGTLSWNTMKQKLKYPRTQTIGLLLPDNLWIIFVKIVSLI